jgi:predicted MFS family arabinose efflux permease
MLIYKLIFLPESPRWLIAHDRLDEAVAVLAAIESTAADEHTPAVIARRDDIIRALELEHAQGPVRWGELFENNETKNRRRVILAIGIQVFQQMSGVNALVYYIPYLLQTTMGLAEKTSLWVSGLNGLVFFLSSAYPIFFLDKYGRPKPFMVASTVQSISMVMVAILLSINTHATNNASIGILLLTIF